MVLGRHYILIDLCILPFPSLVAKEKKGVENEAKGRGSGYNSTKEPKILDRCSKLVQCWLFYNFFLI